MTDTLTATTPDTPTVPTAVGDPVHTYPARYTPDGGMTVTRRHTTAGTDPFTPFTFTVRTTEVGPMEVPVGWSDNATKILASKYARKTGVPQRDSDGTVITNDDGTPKLGRETSAKEIVLRLANAWADWGRANGYFASSDDADAYRDEMAYILMGQLGAPNSPQWFNTGIWEAYGILEDPEGNSYVDPVSGQVFKTAHKYERSAVNACFINRVDDVLVDDDAMGIVGLAVREARLFKAGSGSGANLSDLRAEGEPLSAGGTASGPLSYMKMHDANAGAIKSGGTTRRAAKMVILNDDHPDIMAFIRAKANEERKRPGLVAAGYSTDWNADPAESVDGQLWYQNANLSVRLSDEFMAAAMADDDWDLVRRTDGVTSQTLKAVQLEDAIAQASWECADPGVQFDGTINAWHTSPEDGRINGSNPCSEYMFLDDTACNLASINLARYYDAATTSFDTDLFLHDVRLWTLTLEISVTMSHYPSEPLARNSYEHRTLGLGFANLGGLLMRAGIPYDSDAGRAVAGAITSLLTMKAWHTSAEMAKAVGPCIGYGRNAVHYQRVIDNHRRATHGTRRDTNDRYDGLTITPMELDHDTLADTLFADLSDAAIAVADDAAAAVKVDGARNAQVSVLAPTGTIGFVMDVDTTGIEPELMVVKRKMLAGGGMMRIVNPAVEPALDALGYTAQQVQTILTYIFGTQSLDGDTAINRTTLASAGVDADTIDTVIAAMPTSFNLTEACSTADVDLTDLGFTASQIAASDAEIYGQETIEGAPGLNPAHLPVFDTAMISGNGTRTLSWEGHVDMMAACQPFLSGAISKTVNLPEEATADDIRDVHRAAYTKGVKAIAVYRANSKGSSVYAKATDTTADTSAEAPTAQPEDYVVIDGDVPAGMSPTAFYNGHGRPPKFRLPATRGGGRIEKISIGGHDLFLIVGEYADGTPGEIFIELSKEGSTLKAVMSGFAMAVSVALQSGVSLEALVDKYVGQTFEPAGVVTGHPNLKMCSSPFDAIFRILGYRYLGRRELVQVPDLDTDVEQTQVPAVSSPAPAPAAPVEAVTRSSGFDLINPCPSCGQFKLLPNGSCKKCANCSETTGCS